MKKIFCHVIKYTQDELDSELNNFIYENSPLTIISITQVATTLETEELFATILTTIFFE